MTNNQNKGERCCEKCEIIETFNESYCKNKDCCCHTPQSNTLGTIIDWEEKFKEEFGIHFKESSGELQFAIAFISNLLQQERDKVIKWIDKRCEDNIKASGTDKWNEDMEDLKAKLNKEQIYESNTKTIIDAL